MSLYKIKLPPHEWTLGHPICSVPIAEADETSIVHQLEAANAFVARVYKLY